MASTNGLPVPTLSSANNPPADFLALANAIDEIYGKNVSTTSALPATGNFVGQQIWVSDRSAFAEWTASGWVVDRPSLPTGAYLFVSGRKAPTGTLICDGASYSVSLFPLLAAYLRESVGTTTMTIANPGVFTKVSHGLVAGDRVYFTTTGALPTGLSALTVYYVIAAGLTADAFQLSTTAGGSAIVTSGTQSGTHTLVFSPYETGAVSSTTFKIPDNGDYVLSGRKPGSTEFGSIGVAYGSKTHTLAASEIPAHTHPVSDPGHSHNIPRFGGGSGGWGTVVNAGYAGAADQPYNYTAGSGTGITVNANTGSGGSHNNVQPTRAALIAIKI